MSRYYIIPYNPAIWRDPDGDPATLPECYLNIELADFLRRVRQTWRSAECTSERAWEIDPNMQAVSGEFSGQGYRILTLRVGKYFNEFVLWYRAYVPLEYPLYLFAEGAWESLLLTPTTCFEEIASFTSL